MQTNEAVFFLILLICTADLAELFICNFIVAAVFQDVYFFQSIIHLCFLLNLKLKFSVSNLEGGERQLGNGNFKKAKKFPRLSIETALGVSARYVNTINSMLL